MRKLIVLLSATLLLACVGNNQAQNVVDPFVFDSILQSNPNVQVLDVRTPGEFAGGFIGKALNMDYNAPDFQNQITQLDKSKPVLVYCLSGGRSHSAAKKLRGLGYVVTELDGGMAAWKSKNLPVEGVNMAGKSQLDRVAYMASLDTGVLHLVDFNAKWCLPCRKLLPIVDSLAKLYPDEFIAHKMDYDQYEKLAREFGAEGLPYLVMIKNGEVVWTRFGLPTATELQEAIEAHKGN
ncbi:MAG: thioredoxin domain-containing protein [Bacteroidota bacterium]|nr:thioredoxin domain-containing protein [Bacteroidota bacterium]MDX5430847.1 thioredoxin domain-containing protein [Bacteroidota bacterium]MDX5469591.1 thioredoxin domain-containing protein [Bacteroidota bacterium]